MAQPHNKKLGEYPMTTRGREQGPEKRYRRLRFPAFAAAKWTAANPLLQRGELGVETDTRKIKVGDGITYWNDLEYAKAYSDWGNIAGDITEQTDLVDFVNAAVAAEANIRSQADQQLQANIDNVATDLSTHEQDTNNPHDVTKTQVGLGNVDNTSDIDKPVSTAQATALNNAVSEHNTSDTAHSNLFSQYRTSASQDNIDSNLQSQIANNDTNITNLQSTKADKATTLAGYGITDAYTKTQVDQKINDVQGDVDTLNTKVPSNASASNKMATAAEISNLQNQIDENALEIKGLQGAGGALTATNLGSNPTQQAITEYAIDQIWPNNTNFTWDASNPAASTFTDANGIARTAAEIFNGTWVNNTADNMRWQLTNTQNTTPTVFEWANVGQDIVGIANTATAGIIRVGDGSQMVVSPATGDISLDASKASEIRDTIGAIANDQGTVNAGKLLGVGDDGNVAPVDNPVMGDYVIYWDSADTTDHSHAKPGVATPTDNGWYRVYKSGWCEQGGRQNNTSAPSGAFDTVYLHIPMKDKNYSFNGCFDIDHSDANSTVVLGIRRCRYSENDTPEKAIVSTTYNIDGVSGATGHYYDWEVKGWAA